MQSDGGGRVRTGGECICKRRLHFLYRRQALLQFLRDEQRLLQYLRQLFNRQLFRERIQCKRLHELLHMLQLRNQLRFLLNALSPLRKRDDCCNLIETKAKIPAG